jgi:hypothetical protein
VLRHHFNYWKRFGGVAFTACLTANPERYACYCYCGCSKDHRNCFLYIIVVVHMNFVHNTLRPQLIPPLGCTQHRYTTYTNNTHTSKTPAALPPLPPYLLFSAWEYWDECNDPIVCACRPYLWRPAQRNRSITCTDITTERIRVDTYIYMVEYGYLFIYLYMLMFKCRYIIYICLKYWRWCILDSKV